MAMAVDTNVIIYERTKEELFAGKGIREAYNDGFKHALSAIIDGHATTLLTAVVLYIFGTGPIRICCNLNYWYPDDVLYFCTIVESNDLQ